MFSVAVGTLGCKLNQLESEAIAGAFAAAGFQLLPWAAASEAAAVTADIFIINTCTVTAKADQKARRLIRKTLRDNPRSCVIVAGCYAQLEPLEIERLAADSPGGDRRLFVLSGGGKSAGSQKRALLDLPQYLRREARRDWRDAAELLAAWDAQRNAAGTGAAAPLDPFGFAPQNFSFHTRGYLKIQDGCENRCAYCRVHLARGGSVSLAAEQALAELAALEQNGYAEAMITGVNISQYRDTASGGGLAALLRFLVAGTDRIALRLASLDPHIIDENLAAVLTHPRIRPHFHLSIQSGSPLILRRMGRQYTPETVERGAALLRAARDDPFVACDIIAGFPGETQAEFEQTLALCRRTGFAWIHAFPYSKRPGTPAASFPQTVCERDAATRVAALLKIAREGRREYVRRWVGREVEVLVERGSAEQGGACRGVSDNYLKLLVAPECPDALRPGSVVRRVIRSVLAADGEGPDAQA
jgi:threonylcarbamoyladenosine tRNA methylthiotransferase MtaB